MEFFLKLKTLTKKLFVEYKNSVYLYFDYYYLNFFLELLQKKSNYIFQVLKINKFWINLNVIIPAKINLLFVFQIATKT